MSATAPVMSVASADDDRWSEPAFSGYPGCRVMAATAVGIMKLAIAARLDQTDTSPESRFRAAFDTLRQVVANDR